ncbi:MAG: DUF4491 family protein [Lachnospiraceae bacterium]|nr:DUF4491 family protein [Lachnospiraceae bacterium]
MYFQGIFFSVICFSVVIVCEPFVSRAESLFSNRIWPLLLCAGIVLFFISVLICYAWISALLCSAALTLLYGAFKLKQRPACRKPPRCASDRCHRRR